jgi:RNA polymerase sigma factor (sigma-70 family)
LSNHVELSERDRARWRAARDGDQQVRQELVESAIAAVAMRLGRFSGHDLDEIRQMIAAAILQAFELGIEPASSLEGFLQWRARGQISRFVRQRVRDGGMPSAEAVDWAYDGESPLRRATESELWEVLMACIAKVPSKEQRESFAQRVVYGREPRDIAAERGVEARRVRVWIARAAILVRECLSRRWNREDQP